MNLRTLYERYYAPLKLLNASRSGRHLHEVSLRNFERFLGRSGNLSDLTDAKLTGFMAWHIDRGNSPYTANLNASRLVAQWRLACRLGLRKTWPEFSKLPEPRREAMAWSRQQLALLFAALLRQKGRIAGIPAADWWLALHWLLWVTGERIGALLALEWCAYEADGWLYVPAEARKGQTADRVFRLSVAACAAVEAIKQPPRRLILPWDRDRSVLWWRYKKILRAASLPHDRKSMFHRMRKSTASYYEAAGGDATELLGHSERKVTMAYLDARIIVKTHAADVLFDPRG